MEIRSSEWIHRRVDRSGLAGSWTGSWLPAARPSGSSDSDSRRRATASTRRLDLRASRGCCARGSSRSRPRWTAAARSPCSRDRRRSARRPARSRTVRRGDVRATRRRFASVATRAEQRRRDPRREARLAARGADDAGDELVERRVALDEAEHARLREGDHVASASGAPRTTIGASVVSESPRTSSRPVLGRGGIHHDDVGLVRRRRHAPRARTRADAARRRAPRRGLPG